MNKNQNFKFKKKSPKSTKFSDNKKVKFPNDYSKIICEVLDKNKEESKDNINNSNNNSKLKNNKSFINNSQISNKYHKNIIKIELNYIKKNSKNNLKEEAIIPSIKEKKLNNIHNKINNSNNNKNIFQSNSEKNITKEKITEEGLKKNKINNSNTNVTSLNKNKKININLNSLNDNFILRKQKSSHNKKEENKSTDKKIGEKFKNIEDIKEKTININEIFGNKKGNEHIKQFYLSNGNTNEMKNNNSKKKCKQLIKKNIKNKNLNLNNNSPEKIIIKINNVGNHNTAKNKMFQKKIHKNNTGMNFNDIIESKKIKQIKHKKKYIIHNNTENSQNNQNQSSSKINAKKKCIINIKNNNNSSKNSSHSKINHSNNQVSNVKGVKIESINLDLNLTSQKSKKINNTQKKEDINIFQIDKNSLTLRETEIPKNLTKLNPLQRRLEFSLNGNNENNELNHSFKTAFSITKKTRSLSKKRDEKKKMNWFKLNDMIDEEENQKKLNEILINLSNHKEDGYAYRNTGQRSEPKKLIDKIRKAKKMQKL